MRVRWCNSQVFKLLRLVRCRLIKIWHTWFEIWQQRASEPCRQCHQSHCDWSLLRHRTLWQGTWGDYQKLSSRRCQRYCVCRIVKIITFLEEFGSHSLTCSWKISRFAKMYDHTNMAEILFQVFRGPLFDDLMPCSIIASPLQLPEVSREGIGAQGESSRDRRHYHQACHLGFYKRYSQATTAASSRGNW